MPPEVSAPALDSILIEEIPRIVACAPYPAAIERLAHARFEAANTLALFKPLREFLTAC